VGFIPRSMISMTMQYIEVFVQVYQICCFVQYIWVVECICEIGTIFVTGEEDFSRIVLDFGIANAVLIKMLANVTRGMRF
jgi:hypothetical protein